jgi:hypothetical protein
MSGETRLTAPLLEYQKPILRNCSLLVHHFDVTSIKTGETPDSMRPRKNRFVMNPPYEVQAGVDNTTAPQKKQIPAQTLAAGSFWPRIESLEQFVSAIRHEAVI